MKLGGYLREALGGECKLCGETSNLELDHIIPLSEGGKDSFFNIQLLCEGCHRQKTAEEATRRFIGMPSPSVSSRACAGARA